MSTIADVLTIILSIPLIAGVIAFVGGCIVTFTDWLTEKETAWKVGRIKKKVEGRRNKLWDMYLSLERDC